MSTEGQYLSCKRECQRIILKKEIGQLQAEVTEASRLFLLADQEIEQLQAELKQADKAIALLKKHPLYAPPEQPEHRHQTPVPQEENK